MTAPAEPQLKSGRAYRTRDLARWGRNPTRLAQRLVPLNDSRWATIRATHDATEPMF